MPTRMSAVDAAARRAQLQLDNVIGDLVNARHKAGLPQRRVARALGVSRSLVAAWEVRRVVPTHTQLSQWGAAVGLDVSLRTFLGGPPLRDAGQLRILSRLHVALGATWTWRTEVPISRNPADRRAMDAVLSRDDRRVGVEAVSRLTDAEGQIRPILLKQHAAESSASCWSWPIPGTTVRLWLLRGPRFRRPFRVRRVSPWRPFDAASYLRPTPPS